MPVRTCSEICIDANNHKEDIEYLDKLRLEIIENFDSYSGVQLQYMNEHLRNLVSETAQREAAAFKEILSCFGIQFKNQ